MSNFILDKIADENPEAVLLEPREVFDKAVVGVARRINLVVACYSRDKIIDCLQQDQGLEGDDAHEWLEYNIEGAWCGEHTPIILEEM